MKATALVCESCGAPFERTGRRGPIPRFCLECRADRQRAAVRESARRRRATDPEGERAKAQEWRAANPDKVRQWDRERHERDREKRNASSRAWHAANPERGRELAQESIRRQRERDIEAYRAKRAAAGQRRRALRVSAAIEDFRHVEVFERDGWTCQLCGELVDRSAIFPDPRSPSLDHIVPLSRGGAHARSNTQLACLSCNIKKGNRPWPIESCQPIHPNS